MSGQKIIQGLTEALDHAGCPSDIPQDVWAAAEKAFDLALCNCTESSGGTEQFRIDSITPLARAILAAKAEEREACAAALEDLNTDLRDRFEAVAAIRKRGDVNTVSKNSEEV
jgi:hypothetical protein